MTALKDSWQEGVISLEAVSALVRVGMILERDLGKKVSPSSWVEFDDGRIEITFTPITSEAA